MQAPGLFFSSWLAGDPRGQTGATKFDCTSVCDAATDATTDLIRLGRTLDAPVRPTPTRTLTVDAAALFGAVRHGSAPAPKVFTQNSIRTVPRELVGSWRGGGERGALGRMAGRRSARALPLLGSVEHRRRLRRPDGGRAAVSNHYETPAARRWRAIVQQIHPAVPMCQRPLRELRLTTLQPA